MIQVLSYNFYFDNSIILLESLFFYIFCFTSIVTLHYIFLLCFLYFYINIKNVHDNITKIIIVTIFDFFNLFFIIYEIPNKNKVNAIPYNLLRLLFYTIIIFWFTKDNIIFTNNPETITIIHFFNLVKKSVFSM